jgi:hypothetical protein
MSIVSILEEKLNTVSNSEILSLTELTKAGLCSSLSGGKNLLRTAQIPSIKLGGKVVFAKKDVITFLHKAASCGSKESE